MNQINFRASRLSRVSHAGCSKRLSSKAAASEEPEAYPLGYVEDLNDARTPLAGFFSILLALFDGHIRPAVLTGINLVRTEQFILAKLLQPVGQPPRHPRHRE
jgi:hypothetical protein